MKTQANTTIDVNLKVQALKEKIPLNDALELGIKIFLGDLLIMDYPDCKLTKRLNNYKQELANAQDEINRLKEIYEPESKPATEEQINKEMEEVFKE